MNRYIIGSLWDRDNRNGINSNFEYLFEGSKRVDALNSRADNILRKSDATLNEAQKTNDMNKNVQSQINTLIAESGTSDAEVLQARVDTNGIVHTALKDRLDNSQNDFIRLSNKVGYATPESFGAVGDGVADDTQALQDAATHSHLQGIKIINFDRNKQYNISKPIYLDRWSNVDFGDAIICKTTNTLGSGSNTYNIGTTQTDLYNKDAFFIVRHPDNVTCTDMVIKNIRLQRTASNRIQYGIYAPRMARFSLENIWSLSATTDYLLFGYQLYMSDTISNLKQYNGKKTILIENDGSDLGGSTSLNFNHIVGFDQDGVIDLYGTSYSVINNPMIDRNNGIAYRFRSCPGITINSPSIEVNIGSFLAVIMSKVVINTPRVMYNRMSEAYRNLIVVSSTSYLTINNADIRDYEGAGDSSINMDLTILDNSHVVLINSLLPKNGNSYRSLTGDSTLITIDKDGTTYRDAQSLGMKANGIRQLYGLRAPTTGDWKINETIINTDKAANNIEKWVCTATGSPGTWRPIYIAPKKLKGTKEFVGDGVKDSFTFTHTLGAVPQLAHAWEVGEWANHYGIKNVTYNSTSMTITTKTVPNSGHILYYSWYVEL